VGSCRVLAQSPLRLRPRLPRDAAGRDGYWRGAFYMFRCAASRRDAVWGPRNKFLLCGVEMGRRRLLPRHARRVAARELVQSTRPGHGRRGSSDGICRRGSRVQRRTSRGGTRLKALGVRGHLRRDGDARRRAALRYRRPARARFGGLDAQSRGLSAPTHLRRRRRARAD